MPGSGWTKLSPEEIRLAQVWYQDTVEPSEIAERLGRDKSTITRLCVAKCDRKVQGRPPAMSDAQVDFMVRRLDQLVHKAKGRYHVTAAMLRKSCRLEVSDRKIKDSLHERNIYFRKLREKPLLTEADVAARLAFSIKYKGKRKAWWKQHIHAFIDGKHFKVYLNGKDRVRAAQHHTYGAYRTPGKGLSGAYVKAKKSLQHNTGAKSCLIMAGVGNGRVMMWHQVAKSRWNGDTAATMYTKHLGKALKKQFPRKRKWTVLEDNDPTGFKSGAGVRAKAAAKIEVFEIPKRSPDLSLCDYALWTEINKRMRRHEAAWRSTRRETRDEYIARLRRTAMRLPRKFIESSIEDMPRRCQRLFDAQGGYFEEGGK